ncbi:MAG: GNAT family N-acetyltransferase [Chloroflexi bacterium]|nr:GNAT family N-acetyltransferase [Chloroflexota bacterium]MBI3762251.1 GNAT family N-acetyltransferase [Chloroflexota bacterium]
MTTATATRGKVERGLRPTNLARDLGGIATLMEACFGPNLDSAGRSAVREMHSLSRTGPLLWLLGGVFNGPAWSLGFVWIEDGRVAGNISTQRAGNGTRDWLIANVAVLPEYRHRGIARALTEAALNLARRQGGAAALLQVDHDNVAAATLYAGLAFDRLGTHTLWTRHGGTTPLPVESPGVEIRPRRESQWAEEFTLAGMVRSEGLEWTRPLRADDFRPSFLRSLDRFLTGGNEERWIAEAGGRLLGSLIIRSNMGDSDLFALLLHPDYHEQLANPLLVRGLRRLGARPWPVRIDHPTDQDVETLRALGFTAGRSLIWMRRDLR